MRYSKLTLIFLAGLIFSCANPLPPSGGPPDKTPPKILATDPLNGTLNFKDKYVTIEFNKYMDRNSVVDNVSISPTKKLSYSWSGKELDIKIEEPLDTNTTYAITLGTDYTDYYNKNKPAEAFTLVFSTGKNLDSGIIKGKLFDKDPSGATIFAYKLDGINPDSLDIRHTKPLSKMQVGSNGNFQFLAMKYGNYRIFAVRDKFKDGIYDEGMDAFGAASRDMRATNDTSAFIPLKIGNPVDKIPPVLFSIDAINNRTLAVNFSEELDSNYIKQDAFILTDSLGKKAASITSAFTSLKSGKQIILTTASPLDTSTRWKIKVKTDSINCIRDTAGNMLPDSVSFAYFYSVPDNDSLKPALSKPTMTDSSTNIDPARNFDLLFNTSLKPDDFQKRLRFFQKGTTNDVNFSVIQKAENYYLIKPETQLNSEEWYELDFKMDSIHSINGFISKDTTYKMRFKTKDLRNNSKISGLIKNLPKDNFKYYVIIQSKDFELSTQIHENGGWTFEQIPPGKYTFEVFCDKDGNGKYSFGESFPFKFAEPFMVFDKEYEFKPRWDYKDILLIW